MGFHSRRTTRATGSFAGNGQGRTHKTPRVAVGFDRAMFERIAGEAARRGIPFAEVVREKVLLAYRHPAVAQEKA